MYLRQATIDDRAGHRGDVDDRALPTREHRPTLRLAGQEDAGQIDVHHAAPLLDRHVLRRRGVGDAGAVDSEAQGAQGLLGLFDRPGHRRALDDVASHDQRATPFLLHGGGGFLVGPAASFVTGVDLLVDGGFACW